MSAQSVLERPDQLLADAEPEGCGNCSAPDGCTCDAPSKPAAKATPKTRAGRAAKSRKKVAPQEPAEEKKDVAEPEKVGEKPAAEKVDGEKAPSDKTEDKAPNDKAADDKSTDDKAAESEEEFVPPICRGYDPDPKNRLDYTEEQLRRIPLSECTPHEIGRRGEFAAANFLRGRGYEILERNWKCPMGEADIVAKEGDNLVFVEVKTRTDAEKGFPEEAVDAKKRSRYEKIAAMYLADKQPEDCCVRFDVISLLVLSETRAFLRHHINAFSCLGG